MQKHIKMEEARASIVRLLTSKAAVKQDIADYSESVLDRFKKVLNEEIEALCTEVTDDRVRIRMEEFGSHEFRLYIGSDVLVFQLHGNVFRLPEENPMWKSGYLSDNETNGYFGIINVYNFLAESFEQNRMNDPGYLIGRIFMNHEKHFMVEGEGQLGFLYRDIENDVLNDDIIRRILLVSMAYAIEFDLLTPPFELIQEVSVMQINAISSDLQVATGKRLGFKFGAEGAEVF